VANNRSPRSGGMASSLTNFKFLIREIDPNYSISTNDDLRRGATGYLGVFSVMPNSASLPQFHGRIDDGNPGNRRQPELDIDIVGASNKAARYFKAGSNGYEGHHTDISPSAAARAFAIKIRLPGRLIFDGEVSFNAHFSVTVNAGAYTLSGTSGTLITRLIPAKRPPSLIATLKGLFARLWRK